VESAKRTYTVSKIRRRVADRFFAKQTGIMDNRKISPVCLSLTTKKMN